jgi:hypothetical protein
MVSDGLTAQLSLLAKGQGAAGFGVADVAPFGRELATLRRHRDTGWCGPLRFTYDEPDVATDTTTSFSWARYGLNGLGWQTIGP